MTKPNKPLNTLFLSLQERAKELNCLLRVEEILNRPDADLPEVCADIITAIPDGWQYPTICRAVITVADQTFISDGFVETSWVQSADIIAQEKALGRISIYYSEERPPADHGPFLKEETKLIQTIADRLGHYIVYRRMRHVYSEWQAAKDTLGHDRKEWQVVIDLLRETDRSLYFAISHKMLNHLSWSGIESAKQLLQTPDVDPRDDEDVYADSNIPHRRRAPILMTDAMCVATFAIAVDNMSDDEILAFIQKRMHEDKMSFLIRALNRDLSLPAIADAVRRYHKIAPQGIELPSAMQFGMHAALIRRFFSESVEFVDKAKRFIDVNDFSDLVDQIIFLPESRGKLGGKSAGLYLASRILNKSKMANSLTRSVKTPKTWYLPSDGLMAFINYNNLEEIAEQKYNEIDQIRAEYPHILYTFKNGHFPPEMLKGLAMALDDLGERPLIVRSSSLLEDRIGAAFSGKYKSLFLANQGSKQERLDALCDAIAEVYASTFSPDPIQYRMERGLLDYYEEMGIMIQEVVGVRVGDYFLPAFAGVAFSNNEFRWSPRIQRNDGLVRLVPGLGTRAVDRVSDDYPILLAPGQPNLRVNVTVEEQIRYSPKKIDVINLRTNSFETVVFTDFLRRAGSAYPRFSEILSIFDGDHIRSLVGRLVDFRPEDALVTFEGLFSQSSFVKQVATMLAVLQEEIGSPIDFEFASDGQDIYLLQCRPQSNSSATSEARIPKDIAPNRIIFTARKYISNGQVPDITHIVYVDPQRYAELGERAALLAVGRAVGKLNKLLPKRQFILMGPGRWGSRGDIKLGVSVTYSDISNTAALIEIARKQGNYVPDLSFGTHFFQDLVEASIRYIPLYPDDPGIVFNEHFLRRSPSILGDILPEFANLSECIRVIDVPQTAAGSVLQILMNARLEQAIGLLSKPRSFAVTDSADITPVESTGDTAWRWRVRMVEELAKTIDVDALGVKGMYLFGSTKNATAGPRSDINLIVHFSGTDEQRRLLETWLTGWSLCLDEVNYLRTGYKRGGLLDAHIITDEEYVSRAGYAAKIGATSNAARPLRLGKRA